MKQSIGLLAVAAAFVVLPGCTTPFTYAPEHTLIFGSNGRPRVPISAPARAKSKQEFGALQVDLREQSEDDYQRHVGDIFHAIGASAPPTKCPDIETPGVKRVLVYVHGGLINYGPALEQVSRMLNQPDDGRRVQDCFYPVFVNWRSSLVSSYSDHLFAVRQGRRQAVLARLTSPFALADDVFNLPFGFLASTGELFSRGEGAIDPRIDADKTCGRGMIAVPREHPQAETYKRAQQVIQKVIEDDPERGARLRNGECKRSAAQNVRDYAQRVPFFVF